MESGVGLVDLVEEQEVGDLVVLQLAQNELQLRDLLVVHFAHDHRSIHRRQGGPHVMDKLDRTGTVDEGVGIAHEIRRGDRQLDAHAVVARLLAGVADSGTGVDCALALNRAGPRENCLEERGLAALERAHQCNAPGTPVTIAVLCHVRLRLGAPLTARPPVTDP